MAVQGNVGNALERWKLTAPPPLTARPESSLGFEAEGISRMGQTRVCSPGIRLADR